MSAENILPKCQSSTNKKLFGICDDPPPPHIPAYINEDDGSKWTAIVVNEYEHNVTFTAIDHCLEMKNEDGTDKPQCDGMLIYNDTVIFVELKSASDIRNKWVKDGVEQLEKTIGHFNNFVEEQDYKIKRAYLANKQHPKFRETQIERMNKFRKNTGYILRIENRIIL